MPSFRARPSPAFRRDALQPFGRHSGGRFSVDTIKARSVRAQFARHIVKREPRPPGPVFGRALRGSQRAPSRCPVHLSAAQSLCAPYDPETFARRKKNGFINPRLGGILHLGQILRFNARSSSARFFENGRRRALRRKTRPLATSSAGERFSVSARAARASRSAREKCWGWHRSTSATLAGRRSVERSDFLRRTILK